MKATLTIDVEYDPDITDDESLASALDRLMETALSTPDILDDYGNPQIGAFFVASVTPSPPTDFPAYYRCLKCARGYRFVDSQSVIMYCGHCGEILRNIEKDYGTID